MLERGRGQDHLHRVAAELPGRHQRPRLRRGEVRHRRPDQGAGQRVGRPQACNVNAIAPGYIATDNTQALQDDPDRSRAILDRIPAGRWGRARRPGRRHGVPGLRRRRTTCTARPARRRRLARPLTQRSTAPARRSGPGCQDDLAGRRAQVIGAAAPDDPRPRWTVLLPDPQGRRVRAASRFARSRAVVGWSGPMELTAVSRALSCSSMASARRPLAQ